MRLIDADALKNMRFSCGMHDDNYIVYAPIREVMENIDKAPTVDLPNALRAAGWKEDGWISVKVAKPTPLPRKCDRNKHLPVLLYARKDDSIYVGWYVGEDYRGIDCYISRTSMSSYQHITKKITHWMPLPEPPEEVR